MTLVTVILDSLYQTLHCCRTLIAIPHKTVYYSKNSVVKIIIHLKQSLLGIMQFSKFKHLGLKKVHKVL